MYCITYEEDGRLYQQAYASLSAAEAFARDCAADGVSATLSQELRVFLPGPSRQADHGLRPGRDYPASFGPEPAPRQAAR